MRCDFGGVSTTCSDEPRSWYGNCSSLAVGMEWNGTSRKVEKYEGESSSNSRHYQRGFCVIFVIAGSFFFYSFFFFWAVCPQRDPETVLLYRGLHLWTRS